MLTSAQVASVDLLAVSHLLHSAGFKVSAKEICFKQYWWQPKKNASTSARQPKVASGSLSVMTRHHSAFFFMTAQFLMKPAQAARAVKEGAKLMTEVKDFSSQCVILYSKHFPSFYHICILVR